MITRHLLIDSFSVRRRLWANQSGFLQKEGRPRRGGVPDWHFGHRWPRGLRCYSVGPSLSTDSTMWNSCLPYEGDVDRPIVWYFSDNYYRSGEGFLCLFAVTDQESFAATDDFRWSSHFVYKKGHEVKARLQLPLITCFWGFLMLRRLLTSTSVFRLVFVY